MRPYVLRGEASVDNIGLRCRRHNQYEALLVFGPPAPAAERAAVEVQLGSDLLVSQLSEHLKGDGAQADLGPLPGLVSYRLRHLLLR